MGQHARIEPGGHVSIDAAAWLQPRTAATLDALTADLHAWADTRTDASGPLTPAEPDGEPVGKPIGGHRDWPALATRWLAEHAEQDPPEPVLIIHTGTRLDAEVWILLGGVPDHRVAVVGIDHDPPVVYDDCCDPWDWFQADDVEIICPAGHFWTWRTGRELVTDTLTFTSIPAVFGTDLDAPFTPAPDGWPDPTPWIRCPVCGRRCDVELPTYRPPSPPAPAPLKENP